MRVPLQTPACVPLCAIEGCGRPAHGRSSLCATHKARKMMRVPLTTPIMRMEHDPEKMIRAALEDWYEVAAARKVALCEQLKQLDDMVSGPAPVSQIRAAQAGLAEVDALDDNAWKRANDRLKQALTRYVRGKTAKHKYQARRRQ